MCPRVEGLEARQLLSLDLKFAAGLGVTGTYPDVRANAVAVDPAGDIFVTGSIRGTADFSLGRGTGIVRSAGNRDIYLAEYSPAGGLAWVETMPGANANAVGQGTGLAVDPSGNVLVTGSFSGTVDFDPGTGATSLTSGGIGDAYVAKLDGSGRLLWARDVVGTPGALDAGQAIATDKSGNSYMTGHFADRAGFGSVTLTTGDQDDAFAAKLDPNGDFLWASATNGSITTATAGTGIAVDGSGNVGISGSFSGTVDFDPGSGVSPLVSAGSTDAFLWKLNPDGSFAWADRFGGPDFDQANAVAFDAAGDAVATGTFSGTVSFGAATLSAGGADDVFTVKVDPTGKVAWAKSFVGTAGPSVGRGIGLDGAGDVIVGGDFSGVVDFDPSPNVLSLNSAGSTDAFVAALDPSGNFLNARSFGGSGSDSGLGLAANASGAIALAGPYFGPASFGTTTLASTGGPSLYVAGLMLGNPSAPPPPPAAPSAPVLEAASDTGVSSSDGLTAATRPVFDVGQADRSDTVQLLRDGGVVASRVGPGAIVDPGPVPDGKHSYAARQVNSVGTIGPISTLVSVTVDTTPPAAPPAPTLLAADDSGALGDGITNVSKPRLTGSAEPGTTVQLLDATGAVRGATTAGVDGSYVVTPTASLADGIYSLRVRAIDAAGNVGPAGAALGLTIDATPPPAPSSPALRPGDRLGLGGPNATNVRQPHLIGKVAPGLVVDLIGMAGVVLASTHAGSDGTYTLQVPQPLPLGSLPWRVRVRDVAGNVSATSLALVLVVRPWR